MSASVTQFNLFLKEMVPIVPTNDTTEADHVIRRAFALLRLCHRSTPNASDMLDNRLQENIGVNWKDDYEKRNSEVIRFPETEES